MGPPTHVHLILGWDEVKNGRRGTYLKSVLQEAGATMDCWYFEDMKLQDNYGNFESMKGLERSKTLPWMHHFCDQSLNQVVSTNDCRLCCAVIYHSNKHVSYLQKDPS